MATTIIQAGGNCYALAVQWYGDVTFFVQIMEANDLSDPFLTGVNTLVIPDIDPTQSGGIPSQ